MSIENWIAFVLASMVLVAIPGPAVLFMLSTALNSGFKKALAALPGLALGLVVSISVSLLGAGAVLLASAQIFTALKVVGAFYLIYLGIRLWRSVPEPADAMDLRLMAKKSLFWPAFSVAILNPKALLFYIAFLPQFVVPSAAAWPQFVLLGTTFTVIAILAAFMSVLIGSALRSGVRSVRTLVLLNRGGASAMITSGIFTAFAARNT